MRKPLLCFLVLAMIGGPLTASAWAAPPVAYNDTLIVTRGSTGDPATGTVNVLTNDTDPDGDTLTVTNNSPASSEGGTVGCTTNGECTYTEPGGPCGYADTFTYTASDGTSTANGTVNVTVQCDTGGGGGGGGAFIPRTISLQLRKHLVAKGTLNAGEATNCASEMAVRIQKRAAGSWKTIKTVTTDMAGLYSTRIPDKPGKYRAKATEVQTQAPPDTCGAATSSPQVHRHT